MPAGQYDAIVIGARCAGSPTALLLARAGHKVLVVDRATFPSDTVSTHLVHPPGVAALERWGLLDALKQTGCPPIDTYLFDMGPAAFPTRFTALRARHALAHDQILVSCVPRMSSRSAKPRTAVAARHPATDP